MCTSKGVLKDLEKQIICTSTHPIGKVNENLSKEFQDNFVRIIGGKNENITNPISRVFDVNGIHITALAIPSPGSAQRQLTQFGFEGLERKIYSDDYFKSACNWLNN
ncbi:MAG: hypothetical protein IPK10_02980 [Bacteroidetes bacterium]|nr:hypothetical protein [Bacteroidota bacterium]